MRRSIFALAASSCLASATWNYGRDLGIGIPSPARETGASNAQVDATGWTPRPTEPPGQEAVMELLRRRRGLGRRQETNTWVNDRTCGWFSGYSSSAFTCDETDFTCATNQKNVVGCVSGTSSAFYTVCLDYQAYEQSACENPGSATGCCTDSSWGACGTFLWPGTPQKSMYRCFPEPTIISMLDQPREVLESLTRSTTSSTTSSTSDTTTTSSSTGTGTASPDTSSNSSNSNIGGIVGGVVGGVAGLALIAGLIAYLVIRRKGKYSAVAPTDPAPYSGAAPQPGPAPQYPSQSPPQMAMAPGGNYAPSSPYQQSISTMTTAYDPHQSYYDASKPPGHVSPGQQFTAYQPPYVQTPPLASPPQQFQPQLGSTPELESSMAGHHQGHMSELDSNAMQVGHQYNPAEMGVTTPRPQ